MTLNHDFCSKFSTALDCNSPQRCGSLVLKISSENLHAALDLQVGGSDKKRTKNEQQTNNKQQTTNNEQQTTNNKQQKTNNEQQTQRTTNNEQQTQPKTNNEQQKTNNQQQTTNDKQQRTKHKQLTTYEVGSRLNLSPHPTRHTLGLGA